MNHGAEDHVRQRAAGGHEGHGPGNEAGHTDSQTHGQAMPTGHAESAVDDDHALHQPGQHAGHSTAMFRNKFWASLVLSVPVVVFSSMFSHLLGYRVPEFPGSVWIPPVLGTVIFFYGGMPFLKGCWTELRSRQPGMMLLISRGISVAFLAPWIPPRGSGGYNLDFWGDLALLLVIMLLGHWIEMRALGSARGALDSLAELLPDDAERITADGTETVTNSDLSLGDLVLVRSGGRLPAMPGRWGA